MTASKRLPVLDPLQIGGDESDAQPVPNWQKPQSQEIEGAVERPDPAIGEVADVRRQPQQAVADADLLGERDDLAIALEEVVVEALESRAGNGKGVGLTAEMLAALPEGDSIPALRQAEGGGEPGDAAADNGDMPLTGRNSS